METIKSFQICLKRWCTVWHVVLGKAGNLKGGTGRSRPAILAMAGSTTQTRGLERTHGLERMPSAGAGAQLKHNIMWWQTLSVPRTVAGTLGPKGFGLPGWRLWWSGYFVKRLWLETPGLWSSVGRILVGQAQWPHTYTCIWQTCLSNATTYFFSRCVCCESNPTMSCQYNALVVTGNTVGF